MVEMFQFAHNTEVLRQGLSRLRVREDTPPDMRALLDQIEKATRK